MLVNQKELAAVLGLTDRRIRQLKAEQSLFISHMEGGEGKAKKYKLEECVQEYINYRIETEVQGGTNHDKEKEQAEHEAIKKKISILKLRKLKRELHEASDVEEYLTNMLVAFRERLISIPQKLSPLIVGEDDVNVVMNMIETEMFHTLEELSKYDPDKIDKETVALIEEDEEDEDDEG